MCGIVGCNLVRPLNQEDVHRLRYMTSLLEHRGPDGQGEYLNLDKGVYLGHRRLSIIDLDDRSSQPMTSGRHVISYNGELYNFCELRDALSPSFSFKTSGDTEVILKSWMKWEHDSLHKFDGMFATAIWDGLELHLFTDIFGEKPLFLFEAEDGIYFASEANALIKGFGLQFDPHGFEQEDFLYLGYIRPPATGYKHLVNLSAGAYVNIAKGKIVSNNKYWVPPEPHIGRGKIEPINEKEINGIRDILCDSLQKRLVSDVPVGLFLSGGIDSSLIASLLKRELNTSMEAFSVSPAENYGVDEGMIAKNIAKDLGIDHTIVHFDDKNTIEKLPEELFRLFGLPNDNITSVAVYLMCRELNNKIKVAICGLGGDEVFYGYNKYWLAYRLRYFYRFPKFFAFLSAIAKNYITKAKLLHELTNGDIDSRYLRLKNMKYHQILENITNHRMPKGLLSSKNVDFAFQLRAFDLRYSLTQSHIPATERGSMQASLEVRTPYLSRKLLNYVSDLDQRSLIAYGKKTVLRRLLSRYIDPNLLLKGKQGFIFPAGRYFRSANQASPLIKGLQNDEVEKIWTDRANPAHQQLLIRVAMLKYFYGK